MASKAIQAAGALAGLTMIVGGAEMAVANVISGGDSGNQNLSAVAYDYIGGETSLNDVQTAPMSFDFFDASLGTLTGATFTVNTVNNSPNVHVSGDANSSNETTLTVTATNTYEFSLSFDTLGLSDLIHDSNFVQDSCEGDFTCSLSNQQILNYGSQQFGFSGGDLSNFIGAGQFGMTMLASTQLGIETLPNLDLQSGFNSSSNWSTTVSLQYEYTPRAPVSQVPEPGTLALFATGIIGLGAAARRRRKQA